MEGGHTWAHRLLEVLEWGCELRLRSWDVGFPAREDDMGMHLLAGRAEGKVG